jgi:hypothetical protein
LYASRFRTTTTYGLPKAYFVEKLEIEDNDEGFKITSFKVTE